MTTQSSPQIAPADRAKLTTTIRLLKLSRGYIASSLDPLVEDMRECGRNDEYSFNLLRLLECDKGVYALVYALRATEQDCARQARLIAADCAERCRPFLKGCAPDKLDIFDRALDMARRVARGQASEDEWAEAFEETIAAVRTDLYGATREACANMAMRAAVEPLYRDAVAAALANIAVVLSCHSIDNDRKQLAGEPYRGDQEWLALRKSVFDDTEAIIRRYLISDDEA